MLVPHSRTQWLYFLLGLLLVKLAQAVDAGGTCRSAETAEDILNAVQETMTDSLIVCLPQTTRCALAASASPEKVGVNIQDPSQHYDSAFL